MQIQTLSALKARACALRVRPVHGSSPTERKRAVSGPTSVASERMPSPGNQLDTLKSMSLVVADTGDIERVKMLKPVDCTTNPSLLLKAVQMPEYEHTLKQALMEEGRETEERASDFNPSRPYAGVVDRLAVNFGCELLRIVPGRVSTEVDAHISYDADALVSKARKLIGLYAERGIDARRVYIKLASTWEGIQACAQLQREGIDCNMTLIFSFAQAVACANANAALISPFVGRIMDWYKAKEGRDSYPPESDPGVLAVRRVYQYYKRYDVKTIVMAASFRNADEIRALAGCDNITISPGLLQELSNSTDPLPRMLEPEKAAAECKDEELAHMDEALFTQMHNADQMAVDKLKSGIDGFAKDQETLEAMLAELAEKEGLALH